MATTTTTTTAHPFYYGTIKKIVGGFGALFSNMLIERRMTDSVKGEVVQTIKVPISYGPREKWLTMLNADPAKAKQTNTVLPRIGYEITGFTYDTSRKATRSSTVACTSTSADGTATVTEILSPAPWNIDMGLYIMANKTEDVLQVLEQVLPYFNPDYSITLNAVPNMNITSIVPITLNGVSIQDDYSGDAISQRLIVYTLQFTAKANLYGAQSTTTAITTVDIATSGTTYETTADTSGEGGNTVFAGTATTRILLNALDLDDDELVVENDVNIAIGERYPDGKVIEKRIIEPPLPKTI